MITLVASVLAAIPSGLRPVAAPSGAPAAFADQFPDASPLACEVLVERHVDLCFRVWVGKKRTWVTESDLTKWGVTVAELRAKVAQTALPTMAEELEVLQVAGGAQRYGMVRDGEGWAVAPMVVPKSLGQFGEGARVAIPRSGVLLVWRSGDSELDTILAVAAREMYEAADDAVSPKVFRVDDGKLAPFAQANAKGD